MEDKAMTLSVLVRCSVSDGVARTTVGGPNRGEATRHRPDLRPVGLTD